MVVKGSFFYKCGCFAYITTFRRASKLAQQSAGLSYYNIRNNLGTIVLFWQTLTITKFTKNQRAQFCTRRRATKRLKGNQHGQLESIHHLRLQSN